MVEGLRGANPRPSRARELPLSLTGTMVLLTWAVKPCNWQRRPRAQSTSTRSTSVPDSWSEGTLHDTAAQPSVHYHDRPPPVPGFNPTYLLGLVEGPDVTLKLIGRDVVRQACPVGQAVFGARRVSRLNTPHRCDADFASPESRCRC